MAKVVKRENESVEQLIKRFRRKVQEENIMKELRKREYYRSPSIKKKEKHKEAEKRRRKQEAKLRRKLSKCQL